MKVQKLTQVALAMALGMSEAAITKFKSRGMPVDSVAAARAWHVANVRIRISTNPARLYADEIAAVHALWAVARAAMDAGQPGVVLPALQAAMRAVPEEVRHLVELDFDVMSALCAPYADLLRETAGQVSTAAPGQTPMSDDDADLMGRFWYAAAAGEPIPAEWFKDDAK